MGLANSTRIVRVSVRMQGVQLIVSVWDRGVVSRLAVIDRRSVSRIVHMTETVSGFKGMRFRLRVALGSVVS